MIRVAFSTLSCPDWSWNEILTLGPKYGYDGVEVRLLQRDTELLARPEFQPSQISTRRSELSSAGFEICGLASSVRFDYAEPNQLREQEEIGRRYLDVARELGASFVRVFGDVVPPESQPDDRRRMVEQIAAGLTRLGNYAQQLELEVLIETHGDFFDSRLLRELMQLVESPAVGVLWDTHHPWRFLGEDVHDTWQRLQPWVRHTHWKDSVTSRGKTTTAEMEQAAALAHNLMSGHHHADYVLFGGGEFPAFECLRLLRQAGYAGWHCLEWEKMWHPEIEDAEVVVPLFPGKIRWLWDMAANH